MKFIKIRGENGRERRGGTVPAAPYGAGKSRFCFFKVVLYHYHIFQKKSTLNVVGLLFLYYAVNCDHIQDQGAGGQDQGAGISRGAALYDLWHLTPGT